MTNQHFLRLRKRIGNERCSEIRRSLLTRNWRQAFPKPICALLAYVEFQTRHSGKFHPELREALFTNGFSEPQVDEIEECILQAQLACKTGSRRLQQSRGGKVCRSRRRYGRAATRGGSAYRPSMRTWHSGIRGI